MHRETCGIIQNTYDHVLRCAIPYLSEIEQMGLTREPVSAFAHKSAVARAYQGLWSEMQEVVLDRKE